MLGTAATLARRFDGWIDGPAALAVELTRAGRRGQAVAVTFADDGGVSIGDGQRKSQPVILSTRSGGLETPAAIAAAVEGKAVTISVPNAWIIRRSLELPLEAAVHVDGIVASRLSALSPIPPADVLFGHHVTEIDRAARKLHVEVLILPRARIAKMLEWVVAGKAREVEIVAPGLADRPVTLMPKRMGSAGRNRAAKIALSSVIALSVLVGLAGLLTRPIVSFDLDTRRARLEARAEIARRAISDATQPATGAATLPEQAALGMKNDSVSALGALDDLAAALPLHAYASEIVLDGDVLRVSGRTSDLPDVLTSLESSGRFAGTRQIGAATRIENGPLSEFVVETRPLIRTGGALK